MYSNIINQTFQFTHYLLAFALLFIVYPFVLFKRRKEPILDFFIRNYLRMTLLTIVMGYMLVIIKLYEFIGLVLVLIILLIIGYPLKTSSEEIRRKYNHMNAYLYDLVDGNADIRKKIKDFFNKKFVPFGNVSKSVLNKKFEIIGVVLSIAAIVYSASMRFYDAFVNSAPNMADGAVTLSWIKYITERKLFVDGIYPQGFSIYMATLLKFSYIDALYIMKYSGPFNEVLILVGLYFVVLRFTGRKIPAAAAVVIYGLLFKYLPGEYQRQAATNSQEFGFVFILPSLYFYYKYLQYGNRDDLIGAFSGLTSSGLIHLIAFAFAGMGLAVITCIYFIFSLKTAKKRIFYCIVTGILSIIVSAMPAVIGHYIAGMPYYGSSADYASSTVTSIPFRTLGIREYIVLALLVLLLLYAIVLIIRKSKLGIGILFITFYSAAAFALYYAGGALTKMEVIENRSPELISLLIPIIIGISIHTVTCLFQYIKLEGILELGLFGALMTVVFIYVRPAPIIPYKMLRGIEVQKYLEISNKFLPTNWMFVSYDDMTAVVRGKGYHLMADDFLSRYDADNKYLKDKKTGKLDKTPYVFLFYEKKIFVDQVESVTYTIEKKKLYYSKMRKWIEEHKNKFSNISLYYNDCNISIYEINQSALNGDSSMIWGNK